MVSPVGAVGAVDALSSESEHCTRLSPLGDIHLFLPDNGRNGYLRAENSLSIGKGDICPDIIALAVEDRVGPYINADMKISAGAAVPAVCG